MAIAPQFQKLLNSCQEMEFSHLRPLVDRMFENADVALLDFAEKAENNMAQTLFFDAMSEVRKRRAAIEQHLYAELKRSFIEFPVRPYEKDVKEHGEIGLSGLSLIDTDELETTVATQNAAGKLASRIMENIFALKQRLSIVNSGTAITEDQIPGGPAWLGRAFQHAVEQLELENKVRIVFIALFDKYVLNQVDTLFDEFNKRLIQADILPNLRYEVRKQPGGMEIIEKFVQDQDEDQTETEDIGETESQTPSELGDELFSRICDLMSVRRVGAPRQGGPAGNVSPINGGGYNSAAQGGGGGQAGGGYAGAGGGAGGGYAGAGGGAGGDYAAGGGDGAGPAGESAGNAAAGDGSSQSVLVNQISSIQSQIQSGSAGLSSSEFIENIEIDQNLIGRLQNTLAEEREKIFGAVDRRKLPAADTNVIELVGMLFEFMLKEEHLPNVVKALLSRLHTPLLKVAVVDRNFFTHTSHSARLLLNDMTAAGIRWVDENEVERGIFPKMKDIVDKVLTEFKENVEIFDTLLEEFRKVVHELEQRASMVEKRTNEAASGQEKLLAARSRAQNEAHALCRGKPVAEAAREFLQRIWADKLTFILLRNDQGDASDDWRHATELAARVAESTLPPVSERDRSRRRDNLEELQDELREASRALQQVDKEKLINALFKVQREILADDVAPAPPPVQASQPLEEEPVHEDVPAAETLSPEQQAEIERLKNISFGTWFEFQKQGEAPRRAKLSWRSTVTGKFMFVDQMGIKAAVISMQDLADHMLNGTARIAVAEKKPFVDRAMSAIHRMLDRAA